MGRLKESKGSLQEGNKDRVRCFVPEVFGMSKGRGSQWIVDVGGRGGGCPMLEPKWEVSVRCTLRRTMCLLAPGSYGSS